MNQTAVIAATANGSVPHPLHKYLNKLLPRVRAAQARLSGRQQRPAEAIASRKAWISPTATNWADELKPRTASFVASVRSLDDDLVDLLRRTPTTCTPEEAARWRARLGSGPGA